MVAWTTMQSFCGMAKLTASFHLDHDVLSTLRPHQCQPTKSCHTAQADLFDTGQCELILKTVVVTIALYDRL